MENYPVIKKKKNTERSKEDHKCFAVSAALFVSNHAKWGAESTRRLARRRAEGHAPP
jgi:hypothetical protein